MLVLMVLKKSILKIFLLPLFLMAGLAGCDDDLPEEEDFSNWETITVTASAYNSLKAQTEGNPEITAWGDTLAPGMKSIAVSRDLLKRGLSYNTRVKIEGFEGVFVVNDKMHWRWRNKIDIYMGVDRGKAMEWGRRKVEISFPPDEDDL